MGELDAVFRALGDERRRHILWCIQEHHSLSLADLAELVAERERDTDITTLSGEYVKNVYFSLYHNHVPLLEEADLVRYEQEDDLVVRSDRAPSILTTARDSVDSLLTPAHD